MTFTDRTYEGGIVELSEHRFVRCVFRNTQLHYDGGKPLFVECSIGEGCSYRFVGAAYNTLGFLCMIEASGFDINGLLAPIRAMFQQKGS